MSTIKTKPRVLWGKTNPSELEWRSEKIYGSKRLCDALYGRDHTIRVAIIPLKDVDKIVERAALAIYCSDGVEKNNWDAHSEGFKNIYRDKARIALNAAGIPCLKRKASK
jgi:hypothetical protein